MPGRKISTFPAPDFFGIKYTRRLFFYYVIFAVMRALTALEHLARHTSAVEFLECEPDVRRIRPEPVLLDDDPRADDLRQRTESHGTLIAKNVKHVLTHRVVMADFYLLEIATRPPLPPGYIWTDEQSLDQYAIPRLVEILFEKLS